MELTVGRCAVYENTPHAPACKVTEEEDVLVFIPDKFFFQWFAHDLHKLR